ncbi:gamma-glutamyltransferase [Paenibacillus sp. TRM 82003]|nr:gamma-glutamyltransferase [Paenibacillus sp. TRM 82003]
MPQGTKAMVATPHHLASQMGGFALRAGGNAYDAAVAISAALAVVYPHMTGVGGDAFFMSYDAASGRLSGLNGTGRSGERYTPEIYASAGAKAIPHRGVNSVVTVPGMVDAWWELWNGRGRLPWAELLRPAAEYAEEGFPISRNLAYWIRKDEADIRASEPLSRIYVRDGKLLGEGDRLVQPELAKTLRILMVEGRDAFYEGELMRSIVAALAADGSLLTEDDFRSHRSDWVKPLSVPYRGYEICEMPPNSQGFSALIMMNVLEFADLAGIPRTSAAFYHLVTETVKKAFKERDRYLTDPDFVSIPMERLLSKQYAEQLYVDIQSRLPEPEPHLSPAIGQDTAYAAVVDEEGNAVSFIQSLYFDFGAAYIPGDTGILMQNRGSFFSLDASHPNVLAPRKRSFHTLMPGMILKDGKPYALLGTQGGEGQPQTTLSILTGLLDYGCTIQEALALPRWVYGRTWGADSDSLKLENRGLERVAETLAAWGHEVELVAPWDGIMGQAQGIVIDANGVRSGAADPRGDGTAIGW